MNSGVPIDCKYRKANTSLLSSSELVFMVDVYTALVKV